MTAQPQSHLGCIAYTAYSILAGTPLVALYDPSGEELAAAVRQHQPKGVMAFAHAYAELAVLDTPSGTVDSVDYWVDMGDAIHEAHIGAILAKRSSDQRGPPPSTTASAPPSSAGVWWCSPGHCRRSARTGGSASPIPSPRSRCCGRTAAGRRLARWGSSGPGARPSPPGTGTTPTPPIAPSWAATG